MKLYDLNVKNNKKSKETFSPALTVVVSCCFSLCVRNEINDENYRPARMNKSLKKQQKK